MHLSSSMKRIVAVVYLPLAVIYLLLSYIYPTDPVTIVDRHLSVLDARIIALTFASVFIVLWLFSYIAARELIAYSHSIKQYKDGDAFLMLACALLVLAVYLPVRAISKILLNYIAHLHPAFTTQSNMIITYTNVLFPLAVFVYISRGGSRLFSMVKAKVPLEHVSILALTLCVLASTYCFAAFSSYTKLTPSDWLVPIDYKVAMPLRIFTLVVPFLFMWAIGFMAMYQIYFYQQKIRGIIYRNSLRLLTLGLALLILANIAVQYITVFAPIIKHLPAGLTLFCASVIFSIMLTACLLIIKGVNRLRVFEELM